MGTAALGCATQILFEWWQLLRESTLTLKNGGLLSGDPAVHHGL